MSHGSKRSLFVWPLCGALVACGSSQDPDQPSNHAGAGGIVQASAGSDAQGKAGSSMSHAGGQGGAATVGAAGSGGAREAASGGAAAGHAGRAAGGQAAVAGGSNAGGSAGGGALSGQAGEGAAGSAVVEGIPGASTFTGFTLRSLGTVRTGADTCEYLDPESNDTPDPSTWSFERATQTLTWDFCDTNDGSIARGSSMPSVAEVQTILNTMLLVTPAVTGVCRSDSSGTYLELESGGTSTVYEDDTGWCGPVTSDQNYVDGLGALGGWVVWLAGGTELPASPATLDLSTGEVPHDPLADPACSAHPFPVRYQIDVATGNLNWQGGSVQPGTGEFTPCATQSRVLDAAELDSVLRAYQQLAFGVSGPCDSLTLPASLNEPNGSIASVTIDGDLYLIDETASCDVESSGVYAMGVNALTHVVADLAR